MSEANACREPGKGDGTFPTRTNFNFKNPWRPQLIDLNHDGNLDLVVLSVADNQVAVLLGNGDGTLQAAVGYTINSRPRDLAVADINGDGKLDLLAPSFITGNIGVLLVNGDGSFQTPVSYAPAEYIAGPEVADFNGDGKLDVALADYSSSPPGGRDAREGRRHIPGARQILREFERQLSGCQRFQHRREARPGRRQ